MVVGVLRLKFEIMDARSLKDRRRVVKSFKDRACAKLPISVAEVGDRQTPSLATLGVVTVSNDASRCEEVLASVAKLANTLADAVLADVKSELVHFGQGGEALRGGIEEALENTVGMAGDFRSLAEDPNFVPLEKGKKGRRQ